MNALYFLCLPVWGSIPLTALLERMEEGRISLRQREYYLAFVFLLTIMVGSRFLFFGGNYHIPLNLFTGGMFSCLLVCAMTDLEHKWIYDIVILLGFLLGIHEVFRNVAVTEKVVECISSCTATDKVSEWLIFSILQVFLFRRFYGEGDVELFLLCGLMNLLTGGGIGRILSFMLFVFALLGIHQVLRRNVNSKGNLKEKVALAPYIAFAGIGFFV